MKTLAEIAIDAGLVNKAAAARAGHIAEERRLPLVVVLVRELGVDEVALVAALRKHTRVPLADPGEIQVDPEALRQVPRDICARLRVLPIALTNEGTTRVLRVAMADPTDTTAIAELESVTHCEIDVIALPLSAIDELVARGYRHMNTAVVSRPRSGSVGRFGDNLFVTAKALGIPVPISDESEVSVTAQIPLSSLHNPMADELELRLTALAQLLITKGVITEDEFATALARARRPPTNPDIPPVFTKTGPIRTGNRGDGGGNE